ncbi:Cytochrome c5 [Hahella chejuensis KCTC 2396]|uniref:Cytochrome c5 n=1 Tax=Hahella chejuensis (strain KCTC 2396) TaxID=349521 RepID=Q2S8E3_HAHCH|nr:cytochrome c5 family protein [Hahella chejuensis]ABC33081.1 Cytochrome c5 [Hahella chejuensis KCTC 2396]
MKTTVKAITAMLAMVFAGTVWSLTPAEEKIAERIKPVGEVCVEGQECKAAQAAVAAAAPSGPREPADIYASKCFACHDTGVANAPKKGDAAAWGPRIEQGMETLVTHAINGIRGMPPRGTCGDCSDDEIKATVEFIVEQSQ